MASARRITCSLCETITPHIDTADRFILVSNFPARALVVSLLTFERDTEPPRNPARAPGRQRAGAPGPSLPPGGAGHGRSGYPPQHHIPGYRRSTRAEGPLRPPRPGRGRGPASALARLDDPLVRDVVLLRATPEAAAPRSAPWEIPAPDFPSAAEKAQRWLRGTYHGQAELHAPTARDETARGWVFSCNTTVFLRGGRWQDAMLDATVVVPKDGSAPFGLPHSDPWAWLARWDAGAAPGTGELPVPPAPGPAAWFEPTLAQLGPALSVSEHQDWDGALEAARALPVAARALVWARRTDGRGREAVGRLMTALRLEAGVMVLDGSSEEPVTFDPAGVHRLHVIRYR
ncbi:YrhB family protein [Streptomyces sp. AD55]|uniref:YrhB family protein n=1 Tax=Streptomyces sp. AD55 TaxID=3242895 RepID=UPI0035291A44